jgi:photosystem II stability/assembly factor-like uncharacterized protein
MTCGFAAHPNDCETLCVGYTDGSVYATKNGGQHWHHLKITGGNLYGIRLIASLDKSMEFSSV